MSSMSFSTQMGSQVHLVVAVSFSASGEILGLFASEPEVGLVSPTFCLTGHQISNPSNLLIGEKEVTFYYAYIPP